MRRHLQEHELIDYQFELVSEAQRGEFAAHLAECEQCRGQLEGLQQRFASLDLLKGEIHAPADLISRTVEQAGRSKRRRVLPFGLPAWGGAVAAVLVVAAMLMVSNPQKPVGQAPETEGFSGGGAGQAKLHATDGSSEDDTLWAHRTGVDTQDPSHPTAIAGGGSAAKGVIDETPPFAPASAIELVTLPRRDNVQITIYNSADLTLVREQRKLTLKRGWNWLQFMWANTLIDPTSLSLEPQEQRKKIDVQQLVFPPRLRELGRWLIRSETSGQIPFELTYFTSGLSWRAFYVGTLSEDETQMDLSSYVRVTNQSGEDYENAQTRLLVGKVHLLEEIAQLARREHAYGSPIGRQDDIERLAGMTSTSRYGLDDYDWMDSSGAVGGDTLALGQFFDMQPKEIRKEGLSEYFLYTIEGTETIANQWGKRLQSFEANDIEVESLYKYDESRYGGRTIRFVKFANDDEHNLGETPIPDGNVRIYGLADAEGHLTYVGGTDIKYIPVDEEVELNLGAARLVEVEPKLMDFRTENYLFDGNKDVAGWDEVRTWHIETTNARKLDVSVEITRGFGTAYWDLDFDEAGVEYEKYDAQNARFTLAVPGRTSRVLRYVVRTYHGRREDAQNQ